MQVPRSVVWTGIKHFSSEFASITYEEQRWRIEGRVIAAFDRGPAFVSYTIICNDAWQTRHVSASCHHHETGRTITLHRDDHGWTIDDVPQPELDDCIDVDLAVTPFTNSLPINRLSLAVGEQAHVNAAWLRFPTLTIEPLPQRYTRITRNRYRYEAGDSFTAMLDVDENGVVLRYENGWEQVTFSSG